MVRIKDAHQQANAGSKRGAGTKARAVAAAGVVATVGGVGAFGAADAQGKIFACYSKSSKNVKHATSSHCPHGYKSFSWNGVGPQGPKGATGGQGAQGAQGATGAPGLVAGYDHYFSGIISPQTLAKSTSTVVASFAPAAAANYAVTGMATDDNPAGGQALLKCGIRNLNDTSHAPVGRQTVPASTDGTVTATGIVHASAANPVQLECNAFDHAGTLPDAALTGVQLATANGAATALHQNAPLPPRNSFRH